MFLFGFACFWGVMSSLHSELKALLFGVKLLCYTRFLLLAFGIRFFTSSPNG